MQKETPQTDFNPAFRSLLKSLLSLDYNQIAEITDLEQSIYSSLQQTPNNLDGLITLTQAQIMLGNRPKAKAIAHKIWEIGGSLSPLSELLYTNHLLNLGLLDMTMVLLKPKFNDIRSSLSSFFMPMQKFALMTGNLQLIDKIYAFPEVPDSNKKLPEFAELLKNMGCAEHFKNIQKIILDLSKENLTTYEYNFYDDRGFSELEVILYLNCEVYNCSQLETEINKKLEAYYLSSGLKPLNIFRVKPLNIAEHKAWNTGSASKAESVPGSELPYKSNW